MLQVKDNGIKGYCPDTTGDPLRVEKGYAHFRKDGLKDFLNRITAYEPEASGASFLVDTFRGKTALVKLGFISETAFRFRMYPLCKQPERGNEVFSFKEDAAVKVQEDDLFITLATSRVRLSIRKSPWEMTVELDGREMTREQIKDYNVDQKYKSVPVGFTIDEQGRVTDAFETMYLYSDEMFYGFGEKFTDFNKRGQKITIWQRDAQSTNSDISYKGMPYFMSSMGYAVLLNTFTRTHFDMGASSGVAYTMETEDAYLDYYMFCNRDFKGLIKDYTAHSGRSDMIPRWAFGFWMSRMSYMTRQEVEEIVAHMADFGMSVDVVHIDGWMGREQEELLSFDEKRFPDPEGMIRYLRERGIHLSLWMFPYVPATPMFSEERGYTKQFLAMKARGYLVKDATGEPYVFSPGEGDAGHFGVAALDFTNPELVAYLKERVKRLMRMGVGVIKTDFSEEIPEDAVLFDGSTGLQSHNKYTLLYAKTIYEASHEAKEEMGERALLWGRSGYAGSQNYPANWAGDSSASKNNLAAILRGGLSMGISGVSFWGFDIGGFYNCDYTGKRVIPEDDDYIRSVQMGLMSPLSRSHGQSTPREPWEFSKEAQKAFLIINKLRYRMLPYLYSTAYETHREGLPMMRAMLLEYPEDLNARAVATQYMLGASLLVAPVFDQQEHNVYLPKGSFVDLWTGERHEGGGWLTISKQIDRIPLFLRENHMLPMLIEAPMHIADENFRDMQLIVNLDGAMEQAFYDDDVEGYFKAELKDGQLTMSLEGIDACEVLAYTKEPVSCAVINGQGGNIESTGRGYRIIKKG